jgi:hypothetical protein
MMSRRDRTVVVTYIPNGRSEPAERYVDAREDETLAELVDRAIDETWEWCGEPLYVSRRASIDTLWQSRRW